MEAQRNGPESHEEMIPKDLSQPDKRALKKAGWIVLSVLALLFLLGFIPNWWRQRRIESDTRELAQRAPAVQVAKPHRGSASGFLKLPADTRSYAATALYPRASGYIKALHVDVGDRVEEGQLLAEIDSPEVDAQLNQARAALNRSQSDELLAKTTLERYEGFAKSGGVTRQQLDEKRSAENQAHAAVEAAKAEVDRLSDLQRFEKIVAPFSGTVTARNFDVGALLSPSNTAAGKELFRIENTSILRVSVNVPQSYSTNVAAGQNASFFVSNYPGREFIGKVARTSKSLDAASRTLYTEIEVPNAESLLVPGMYGEVRLSTSRQEPLLIPTSAALFDAEGIRVATVVDGKVKFKKVSLGRDFGSEVEALEGVDETDLVITNPGQRLSEGGSVEVRRDNPEPQQGK